MSDQPERRSGTPRRQTDRKSQGYPIAPVERRKEPRRRDDTPYDEDSPDDDGPG